MSTHLHGPGPSYSGAPPWATSSSRDFYVERLRVFWCLAQFGPSNAFEINEILQESTRNQVATRLGEGRRWHFCGAVMLDGRLWYRDIRHVKSFQRHPTEDGEGVVHRLTILGFEVLRGIGWWPPIDTDD